MITVRLLNSVNISTVALLRGSVLRYFGQGGTVFNKYVENSSVVKTVHYFSFKSEFQRIIQKMVNGEC